MKKKNPFISKDKRDWLTFTKKLENIYDKDSIFLEEKKTTKGIKKLDLHGFTLDQANKKVKKFINKSFENGYKKLLIITGKGSRSKVYDNPYLSEQMNVLKNSVPEFIKTDKDLFEKIKSMSKADIRKGGDGAFYVFLK